MFHTAVLDNKIPFVGPYLARQIDLEIYFTVAATAVLLWDIILHAPEDYKQMRKQGFLKLSRVVYCFSRFITLLYLVAYCVLKTVPIGNCNWIRYVAFMSPLVVPITILLFLFRVYALFRNRSYIVVFISISWLLVFGTSVAVAIRTHGVKVNDTEFCMKRLREKDVVGGLGTIARFSHDTLVFAMTSWWLYQSNLTSDDGPKYDVWGQRLLPLTRSLLQDGQAYYLATLVLNIIVIVFHFFKKPIVTPCTLGNLLIIMINNMASHVYRNLVNMKYRDHNEFLQWVDGEFQDIAEIELSTRPGVNV